VSFVLGPETLWASAIAMWEAGDPSRVAGLLRDGVPPSALAREWLAGLAEGRIKRPRGRPKNNPLLTGGVEVVRRYQIREAFRLYRALRRAEPREGDTPTILALEDTARKFALTADAVNKIVFPRRRKSGDP
jgi:hypothetical protein